MKISVAGIDMTNSVGPAVSEAATVRRLRLEKSRRADLIDLIDRQGHILTLSDCSSEREYLKKFFWILKTAPQVHTRDFDIPVRNSIFAGFLTGIRRFFWKFFRYQHDRMAFQQNMVTQQLNSAIRYLENEYVKEIARYETEMKNLANRVAELEKTKHEP